jgi:hypothetical protein
MGEIVRSLSGGARKAATAAGRAELDEARAALVLPVLAQVLGVPHE